MEMSLLKIYSHAIVAANKALDSDIIEAVPTERTQFADGELSDNATKYTAVFSQPFITTSDKLHKCLSTTAVPCSNSRYTSCWY